MIATVFIALIDQYDVQLTSKLWNELTENYGQKNRHYHNLQHLSDLYTQLLPVKSKIENWNVLLFTLFYHDVIYHSTKKNNEAESAKLAASRMKELGIDSTEITKCTNQIIATKHHEKSSDSDTNYFTDADLSILGRDWDTYNTYCQNIRREYSVYPNFIYKKGRQKVIAHFLSMERIFKTEEFFNKFEEPANSNLNQELSTL